MAKKAAKNEGFDPNGDEVHPAAKLFPLMDADELGELAEDIREHGVAEPVVMYRGQLLDGRNRMIACETLGIDPPTVELPDGIDPVQYVLSHNLHRRHLTTSQRSIVAARMATLPRGRPSDSSDKENPQICGYVFSSDQAAQILRVSPRSVETARKVLEQGSPQLVAAVESGMVPVSRAATIAAQAKSEREQMRMAREKPSRTTQDRDDLPVGSQTAGDPARSSAGWIEAFQKNPAPALALRDLIAACTAAQRRLIRLLLDEYSEADEAA